MNADISDGSRCTAIEINLYPCLHRGIHPVLARVNFTNLSTAKATLRAREIGIRKVSGAGRRQIAVHSSARCSFMSVQPP